MNKPQLTINQFDDTIQGDSFRTWAKWKEAQHKREIATALEEQRLGYIAQVKELSYKTGRIEAYAKVDDLSKQRVVTQDILSILNGKE